MRRYGTYLRLVIVSLLVGLAVGVGSWWYFKPQEVPITCREWWNATGTYTDCFYGVLSDSELPPGTGWMRVTRVWTPTLEVPFNVDLYLALNSAKRGEPVVRSVMWPITAIPEIPIRNGLIAAGVAYLLLILIVVPARMLRRPD